MRSLGSRSRFTSVNSFSNRSHFSASSGDGSPAPATGRLPPGAKIPGIETPADEVAGARDELPSVPTGPGVLWPDTPGTPAPKLGAVGLVLLLGAEPPGLAAFGPIPSVPPIPPSPLGGPPRPLPCA